MCTGICFFFNDTATTEIYTLSLHDALPISWPRRGPTWCSPPAPRSSSTRWRRKSVRSVGGPWSCPGTSTTRSTRSEEHTSELQSRQYLVCRLLLEKKKKIIILNLLHTNTTQ